MPPHIVLAARELGLGPLTRFARYQLGMKSGWYRWRAPTSTWDETSLKFILRKGVPTTYGEYASFRSENSPPFFFNDPRSLQDQLIDVLQGELGGGIREAEEITQGRYRLFGADPIRLGLPPDWGAFAPVAHVSESPPVPLDEHWSKYSIDDLPQDIKLMWEIARFGWVYPLCRADAITGKEKYFETLWKLLASWLASNPPNTGPHWYSAQEVGIRLLGTAFANYAFPRQLMLEEKSQGMLTQSIAAYAKRISVTLSYAQSQGNNHLLVEAVALYTAGLLYPELKRADRWRALGRKWTVDALRRQIFEDGGYIQHSVNYQRLALQAGLWMAQLAGIHQEPLPEDVLEKLWNMASLLHTLVQPENGRAPNFGPNDGARIFPWSTQPFDDYRPTIQAAGVLFKGVRLYEPGPWDDVCIWLGLGAAGGSDREPVGDRVGVSPSVAGIGVGSAVDAANFADAATFPEAGLHLMTGHRARGILRAAHFTHRPGHSDQLHFDLWWHGTNVLIDPGSYLYNAPPPWENTLALARYHNTVLVDDQEPMTRAGRFLWLDWAQAELIGSWKSPAGKSEVLSFCHTGYENLKVLHQRTVIRMGDDRWIIADDILGEGDHALRLSWMLAHLPWRRRGCGIELEVGTEKAFIEVDAGDCRMGIYTAGTLVAGEELGEHDPVLGWFSPTYSVKTPALQLIAHVSSTLPVRLLTSITFGEEDEGELAEVTWRPPEKGQPAVERLIFEDEELEIAHAHTSDPSSLRRSG
ncbi:MAG: alginate lyase family protein [Anaerolineales bacterium]